MTTSNRAGRGGNVVDEQQREEGIRVVGGTPAGDPAVVSGPRRLLGGLLTGIAAGCGMYVVLASVAVAQGRIASYPLHAVHALMAGRRVLPEHRGALYGPQMIDLVVGPLYFFVPALAVGLFTAYRVARRGSAPGNWSAAARPAAAATALFFVVFVLIVALPEGSPAQQNVSSGHGIRELGVAAWVVAHLVYVAVLVVLLGPVTRAVAAVGRRRPSLQLRDGEEAP